MKNILISCSSNLFSLSLENLNFEFHYLFKKLELSYYDDVFAFKAYYAIRNSISVMDRIKMKQRQQKLIRKVIVTVIIIIALIITMIIRLTKLITNNNFY